MKPLHSLGSRWRAALQAPAARALLGALAAALALPTFAVPVTSLPLDFSSIPLASNVNVSASSGLGKVANSAAIATAINSQLPAGDSVTVAGALATKTYTGEGFVVGNTLANTAPGGIFIINDSFGIFAKSDKITITLTGFTIHSIEFDWEIFPNGTCPASTSPTSCAKSNGTNANWPDISLWVGTNPASLTNAWGRPATTADPATIAPQALHLSEVVNFGKEVSVLEFRDWPNTIGIADVRLNVPEPGTLALLLAGLAGLRVRSGRRTRV